MFVLEELFPAVGALPEMPEQLLLLGRGQESRIARGVVNYIHLELLALLIHIITLSCH